MEAIGSFTCQSGSFRISDPCYDTNVWCSGQINGVKLGTWHAFVERHDGGVSWGERIARLVVFAEGHNPSVEMDWQAVDFEVGVDSGQAGIFDLASYRCDDAITQADFGETAWECQGAFYSACGSHTLSERSAGCLHCGAVASSGYGDGSYLAETACVGGEIVAVRITFIGDSDEDEDEDEDDLASS